MANIGIDFPSHGLGLSPFEEKAAQMLAEAKGLQPLLEAVLRGRAVDQNADGTKDPGADFLTAYTFHTRDMMRQTVLDYMQLIRVVRSFDGTRRWAFDVNGDGVKELAGDFDGDGVPDVDGRRRSSARPGCRWAGSSRCSPARWSPRSPPGRGLGRRRAERRGAALAPGRVPEAVLLRMMGPLFVGALDDTGGTMVRKTTVPDGIKERSCELARLSGVRKGGTLMVQNLRNGERGCGVVAPEGTVRARVASDRATG